MNAGAQNVCLKPVLSSTHFLKFWEGNEQCELNTYWVNGTFQLTLVLIDTATSPHE